MASRFSSPGLGQLNTKLCIVVRPPLSGSAGGCGLGRSFWTPDGCRDEDSSDPESKAREHAVQRMDEDVLDYAT